MKVKRTISKLLLAFVLVSIGVAIGKEIAANQTGPTAPVTSAPWAPQGGHKVVVYYLHSSVRCVTCNAVESMTDELIRTEFADALKSGRLEWKQVDYLQNEQLAERYNVGGNMIVVARFLDGKEVGTRRLDKVMHLVGDRARFLDYVRTAISELMAEAR